MTTQITTAIADEINNAHDALVAECEDATRTAIERAAAVGDLLIEAKSEVEHGEWIPWVEANLRFGVHQVNNYVRVSRNCNRGYNLPMRKMRKLVGECVDEAEEKKVLQRDESLGETCTSDDLHDLVRSGKTYGTIYADPPWPYDNQATAVATDNHYETTSIEWMCDPANMPIEALAAKECHLHMWTTTSFLREAFTIMEAWGFKYKSQFIWCKPMGMGNYWRVSHEIMLLGVRGGPVFADHTLKSWIELPRGRHSAKPDEVRTLIERGSPGPNRLELFGRKQAEGWTVWGNEVSRELLNRQVA